VSLHDDLILNWAFLDTVTQRSNIDLWLAELEQWKTRAEAAEAALAAVPVEALRRTWQRDIHDDPADADAIDQWLAQPEVQP